MSNELEIDTSGNSFVYLMAHKAFGKVARFRVRPRARYTQLFQTLSET